MYLVLIAHCMTEILAKECKSGKSTVLALGTVCGLVASPGALKPSVGDGTESSWPLVHTYLSLLSSLPSLGSYLHLFSGVYVNNNNKNKNNINVKKFVKILSFSKSNFH